MKPALLSLRWKIILIATLVLALLTWASAWQQRSILTQRFADERAANMHRQHALMTQLFLDASHYHQTLANTLANIPSLRQALASRDEALLGDALEPYWSELNLGSNLEALHFYTPDGVAKSALGAGGDPASLIPLARRAGIRETPMELLACAEQCVYYTAVPIVGEGRNLGALVLGSGLQDLILRFRRLSGAELAVLSVLPSPGHVYLPAMGGHLLSVSGDVNFSKVLHAIAHQRAGLAEYQYELGSRSYRVHLVAASVDGSQAKFAVIEDVTAEIQTIQSATGRSVLWGLSALGLASLLLYALLWPIMQRIRRATSALPLLGEGKYDEVRSAFRQRLRGVRDESDALGEAAIGLSETLERLNRQTRDHAEELAGQADALRRERDFIAGLLDTAPALIVTHDDSGMMRMANAHAIHTSGMNSKDLLRKGFIESFFQAEQWREQQALLAGLSEGDIRHSEGHFQRADGSEREVVWFHSLFEAEGGRNTRLSVGLDVTAHKQAERRLSLLVDHDVVTGLYNRRAFQRELDELMASRPGNGSLIVCDIDEFKAVNEVSGHASGDAMLMYFARQVTSGEPLPILAARLGDDEFAFYYADMGAAEAIVTARQVNQMLVGVGPTLGLPKRSFTTCVGIAMDQDADRHADNLIAMAETALVQARAKGEGNWHLYSPSDAYQADRGRRVYWSDELEKALAENRLVLHYQPIMDLQTQQVSHWEALIRLQDTEGGLIMPGQFMGVAEATGMVRRLDRWVLGAAGRAMRQVFHLQDVRLAVNLSGRSLDDEETFETLRRVLQERNLPGERFILEITETAALANIKVAARLMARYRELGCTFSLDDFGVGYTSFQYLKELPVDSVKIDGSFVVGLKRNRDDQVFVKALTEAVHGFGKKVVAEFVEDGETLEMLREYGVDYAQGYYIGRPASKPALSMAA